MHKNSWKQGSILISLVLCGCANWFGTSSKDQSIPITTLPPPQHITESNAAQASSVPATIPGKKSSSGTHTAPGAYSHTAQQRIEENRNAGEVEQIKVNNRNLPSYYIYPTQQQNYNTNKIPDQNISTPNWQISW